MNNLAKNLLRQLANDCLQNISNQDCVETNYVKPSDLMMKVNNMIQKDVFLHLVNLPYKIGCTQKKYDDLMREIYDYD